MRIRQRHLDILIFVEVIVMENNKYTNKTASGTDVQHVKQKNAQAAANKNQNSGK